MNLKDRIIKSLVIALITSMMASCINNKQANQPTNVEKNEIIKTDNFVVITPPMNSKIDPSADLVNFIDNVRFIPLEITPNSVIGKIAKIDVFNEHIFLFDEATQSILVFNLQGKFIKTIGNQGRGPGEYIEIGDFALARDRKNIVLNDIPTGNILNYSFEGEFINSFRLNAFGTNIFPLNNNMYAYDLAYRDNSPFFHHPFSLLIIDSIGNYLKSNFYYDHGFQKTFLPFSSFYQYSENQYYFKRYNDTIYQIGLERLSPVYVFRFGEYSFDNSIFKKSKAEVQSYLFDYPRNYATFFDIHETHNTLCYRVDARGLIFTGYYSKKTGKTIDQVNIHKYQGIPIGMPVGSSDNYFINVIDPIHLKHFKARIMNNEIEIDQDLRNIIKKHNEFDNPVLVLYSLNF